VDNELELEVPPSPASPPPLVPPPRSVAPPQIRRC
jgi:hypothetical protein